MTIIITTTHGKQIRQQYHKDTLTRIIDAHIHTLDITRLRGIFAQHPAEDKIDHLQRTAHLEDEDFTVLAQYSRRQDNDTSKL